MILNLNYYGDFLGEKEIRFYTNSKDIKFKKNSLEYANEKFYERQLIQGENHIYFFSFWEGYCSSLMEELKKSNTNYEELPEFIKNWNECKGWCSIESEPDSISKEELKWLIKNIPDINKTFKQNSEKKIWDYECISDLLIFLSVVQENDWELRIAEE